MLHLEEKKMMRLIFSVTSLLLIWNVKSITGCLKGSNHDFGTMEPSKDNSFKVNTSHTFKCSLYSHNFTLNNTTVYANCSDLKVSVSSKNINTRCVDPLTVEFDVINATTNDSGYYICKAHKTLICMSSYLFGYEPLPVKNFSCISEEFARLQCSWERAYNPIPTNFSLTYFPDYSPDYSQLDYSGLFSCPVKVNRTSLKTWCEWTMNTSPIYYQNAKILFFRLTGVNAFGTLYQKFTINHHEIIRAGIPQELKANETGKDYAVITWQHPNGMDLILAPPILYEIGYKAENFETDFNDNTKEVGINVFETRLELIPNLKYVIRLRCRVINATNLWSSYVQISLKTKPDVPYIAPNIINQSFTVSNYDTYRTITLYWQKIDVKYCNGDDCQCVIFVSKTNVERYKRTLNSNSKQVNITESSVTFSNLRLDEDYQFVLKTRNKEGDSENSSRIIVPKKNMLPSPPDNVAALPKAASFKRFKYIVFWKPHSSYINDDITSYTVVKCRARGGKCAEEIEWIIKVPANSSSYTFDENDGNAYKFAVAANNKFGASSGLSWAPCELSYDQVNVIKKSQVEVKPYSSTELKVIVNSECREAFFSVAENFLINYTLCPDCLPEKCNVSKWIRVKAQQESILKNLQPFTSYFIRIRTENGNGQSDHICARTNPAAPANPPRDLEIGNVTAHSATVFWKPPYEPNGIIKTYNIICERCEHKTIKYEVPEELSGKDVKFNKTLYNLTAFKEYIIGIEACVDTTLCTKTPDKEMKYFETNITAPGIMDKPEVNRRYNNLVDVGWKPPQNPNGPIDQYILFWRPERDSQNESHINQLNFTRDNTSVSLNIDSMDINCGSYDQATTPFLFYIQAVNKIDGTLLYGKKSPPSKELLCGVDNGRSFTTLTIGLAIGAVLALVPLSIILYMLVRWMREKVQNMKNVGGVELPPGLLNSPHANNTSSYENFKNGLQCNPDASPKPAYGRLDSFISNDDSFKNRHGSGTSQFSATSTDELIAKQNIITEKNKRNPSGDSSGCGSTGGHDSLSSSLTHRTNLSSDSGNEADIKNPPSPEVARDGEASVAKPDEKSLNVSCVSGSKDSGVDKGDESDEKSKSPVSPYSQFSSCVDSSSKALGSYSPPAPYSKFGLEQSCYVPISRGRNLQFYGHNLANSEPSINEMDEVNPYLSVCAEPRTDGTILDPAATTSQYSKLGLSRSIQDMLGCKSFAPDRSGKLMDNASGIEEGAMLPYSRFGMRRLETPSNNNPYITVGMAFSMVDKNPNELLRKKEIPWLPEVALLKNNKIASPGKVNSVDEGFENSDPTDKNNMAYSKIGLGEADYTANKNFNLAIKPYELPSTSKPGVGYVPFDDLKILPISQLVANTENSKDLEIEEIEDLNNTEQRVDDGGGIAPYSCVIPSFKDGDQAETSEPFSLQNLDNIIYTPPSYDDLDGTFTPAKLTPSVNGYVSQDVLLQNSKKNIDRTSFNSLNPSKELLPKPELKESSLPDVNVKRSNGYVSISELPSICGRKDVRFDMPITDV